MDTKGPFPHDAPSPSPGTCTMVSRFCRDVETELMTEEGPMVTTLMWWEGGGGAGTITVGWWVGAGGGRSCKTEALSLFPKVLGAAPSLLSFCRSQRDGPRNHLLRESLCQPPQPLNSFTHRGPARLCSTPLILKMRERLVQRGPSQPSEIPWPLHSPAPSKHFNS